MKHFTGKILLLIFLFSNCISFYRDEQIAIVNENKISAKNSVDLTFRAFSKNGKNILYDKNINYEEIYLLLNNNKLFSTNIKIYNYNNYLKAREKSKLRIDLIFNLNREEIGILKGFWGILHITSIMIIPFSMRTDMDYTANIYSENRLLKQIDYKNSRLDISNLFFIFIPAKKKIDPEVEFIKNTMVYFHERIEGNN